jgi:hypothetical protein
MHQIQRLLLVAAALIVWTFAGPLPSEAQTAQQIERSPAEQLQTQPTQRATPRMIDRVRPTVGGQSVIGGLGF